MAFEIVLCRRKGSLSAAFLRFVLMSRASHSALFDMGRGIVYDSAMLQGGVKAHAAHRFFSRYRDVRRIRVEVPAEREDEARAWLQAQVGKPYDWRAVFGLALRQAWNKANAWQCSELTEAFRSAFECARFRVDASRITPHHQDITL